VQTIEGLLLLRKSESEIRAILDNIPDIFYRTNRDGQFIIISNAAKEILGYEPEELVGKPVAGLYVDPNERSKFLKKIEESGGRINGYEAVLKRKDGSHVWISTNAKFYHDENGVIAGIEGIVRDISERKRLEDEFLKTQKLEAIGVLAGGIAHDFNNLLTAILGNISLSKMHLKPDNKIFDWLTSAENSCYQAKALSSRLITFSAGGLPIRDTIPISDLIRETTSELLVGTNIICECDFPNDLHPVKIDEQQIKEVIKNIVTNAKESMPNGGTLKINAKNVIITEKDNHPLKEGGYVKLSLEDSGKGIEEGNLSRIFDPYFTTKEMGSEKGRGLGLSICYSIIKKHDGLISVDSKVGAGTTVKIYLPSAAK
jgi:PAS domain S-box-containing protein